MSQAIGGRVPTPGGYPKGGPPPQQGAPRDPNAELEEEVEDDSGLPEWFDVAAPWMASIIFHLGIGLVVLFLAWFIIKAAKIAVDAEPIVIPSSFSDPDTPGGVPNPGELNSNRDAAQDKIKDVTTKDGWAQNDSDQKTSSFLQGATGEQAIDAIALGSGGSTGAGTGNGYGSGGPIAPYGTPGGGMGGGPKSNFYGAGGNAVKIVYIIDHSGSLLDNFDFLREEIKRSVGSLLPVQQFAVVTFAEDVDPDSPTALARATTENKRALDKRVDNIKSQGQNDDMLPPFQHAFERAFSMKPQLIYFLTDGHFDQKLLDVVDGLNRDHKVKINTLAFVKEDADYIVQMKDIAKRNGGVYKFVAERDLGH